LNGVAKEAEQALSRACDLEPDNDQFAFALALFYEKYQRYSEARKTAEKLLRLQPKNPQYQQLLDRIKQAASGAPTSP